MLLTLRLMLADTALGLAALAAVVVHAEPVAITPPVLLEMPSEQEKAACYGSHPEAGSITAVITISAEGKVTHIELPPGAAPWMSEAAVCVTSRMTYLPGKRDGQPVESKGTQTFNFNRKGAEFTRPEVKLTSEQIVEIYRACYPTGMDVEALVLFQVAVTERGLVQTPTILQSSGNEQLDQAATCILKKLRFRPARRGDRPARATVNWPILVRPPPQP